MGGRSTARALAWTAAFGVLAFAVAWPVADPGRPGYSALALALALGALGPALRPVLPARRATTAAAALFVASGAALALAAGLPRHGDAHLWAGFLAELCVVATPFAIATALWPAPLAAVSLSAGTTGVTVGVLVGALGGGADAGGWIVLAAWVAIVAAGVLHATRPELPRSALIPLRPRAFLASSWSGDGEILLRPLFVGRLLARRFGATREATWISEHVWRIDDAADLGGGRVQRRQMYCEFVAPDHVHITGGDLPDGIDVWLEEHGYRTSPFRLDFQVGPLPLLLRCHDVSHVAPDGTFVNAIDVRSVVMDIPLARVVFRVRPAPEELRELGTAEGALALSTV
jgi:hypothetical protein